MRLRYAITGAVLAAALTGGGIAAAIGSGASEPQGPACGDLAGVCSTEGTAPPPEITLDDVGDHQSDDGPASAEERFDPNS